VKESADASTPPYFHRQLESAMAHCASPLEVGWNEAYGVRISGGEIYTHATVEYVVYPAVWVRERGPS
jgi:hypothetical protein